MCMWEPLSTSTSCARWKWVVPLMDETWGQVERERKKRKREGAVVLQTAEGWRWWRVEKQPVELLSLAAYIHLTDREVWLSRPPAFSFPLSLLPWPGTPEGSVCCSFFLFSCVIHNQLQKKVGKPWCQLAPGGTLQPSCQNEMMATANYRCWNFPLLYAVTLAFLTLLVQLSI